jgi:MFS family permease
MSQAKPGPEPELRCRECGAVNDDGSSECWLCQRRDWRTYPALRVNETFAARNTSVGPLTSRLGLMVLIAAIFKYFGLFVVAPGLAIALLVGVLPALAITEAKANHRRERGEVMSGTERFLWIVGMMMVILVVVIATLGPAFVLPWIGAGRKADPAAVIFFLLVAVFLGFFIAAILFARSRRLERDQNDR